MTVQIKVKIPLPDEERQPVECWTRVMGYFRPKNHYNKGKVSEFNERKWFTEEKVNDHTARDNRTSKTL